MESTKAPLKPKTQSFLILFPAGHWCVVNGVLFLNLPSGTIEVVRVDGAFEESHVARMTLELPCQR
jgi:hypothetical protein